MTTSTRNMQWDIGATNYGTIGPMDTKRNWHNVNAIQNEISGTCSKMSGVAKTAFVFSFVSFVTGIFAVSYSPSVSLKPKDEIWITLSVICGFTGAIGIILCCIAKK